MKELDPFLNIFLRIDTLEAFLFVIAPGFISLRAYESGSGREHRAVNESLIDIAMYSFASDTIWIPIFRAAAENTDSAWRTFYLVLCAFGIITTAIAVGRGWYGLQVSLAKSGATTDPTPKPWDKFFKRHHSENFGIVLTLPDGRKIGGRFAAGFASSYPADEQLHIGEVWAIDQDTGSFLEQIQGTLGLIIDKKDVLTVELFDWAIVERDVERSRVTLPERK